MDIHIQVRDEKVVVDSRQKNHHAEFKNLLGKIPNGTVVAIGQSLQDLIRENPQNQEKFREEVKFEPIYTSSGVGLDNLHFFIEYLMMKLRNQRNFLSMFMTEPVICTLDLPDYETINEDVRKQFEFTLTKFVARELTVNRQQKGWEKWQRRLLEFSRPILLLTWPVLWYVIVLLIAPFISGLGLGIWVIYILAFFALYYFAVVLRVLILKNLLPHDLIRSELLSPRVGLGRFGVFLVGKLFSENK